MIEKMGWDLKGCAKTNVAKPPKSEEIKKSGANVLPKKSEMVGRTGKDYSKVCWMWLDDQIGFYIKSYLEV